MFRKPEQNIGFYITSMYRNLMACNRIDEAWDYIKDFNLTPEDIKNILNETSAIKFFENDEADGGKYCLIHDIKPKKYLSYFHKPTPVENYHPGNGFIDPQGHIFHCGHGEHITLIDQLVKCLWFEAKTNTPENEILDAGWIKVAEYDFRFTTPLTQPQIDTLEDYSHEFQYVEWSMNGKKYESFQEFLNQNEE